MSKTTRLVVGGVVLAIAVASCWYAYEKRKASGVPAPFSIVRGSRENVEVIREEIASEFAEAAVSLTRDMPVRLDEQTTLVAVEASQRDGLPLMRYLHEVSVEGMSEQEWANVATLLASRACTSKEMLPAMEYGAAYEYVYRTAEGKELFRSTVDEEACRKLEK